MKKVSENVITDDDKRTLLYANNLHEPLSDILRQVVVAMKAYRSCRSISDQLLNDVLSVSNLENLEVNVKKMC